MSVSAIVALLQSALLLLATAQSTPNLPPSFQANAVAVAQSAISQATAALSSGSTRAATSASNQTFTTPSGAIINAQGTVLSAPITAAPSLSIQISTTTAPSKFTIHVEWNTGIPATSKIFFTPQGGETQIVNSESGTSAHQIADLKDVVPNTYYSYTIEAVAGEQDQQISGTWRIFCPLSGSCIVRND